MIGPRFYLAGLASVMVAACMCDTDTQGPSPAPCNVVAPGLVNQEESARLGNALVTPNTPQGQGDVGGNVTDIVQITNLTRCSIRIEKYDGVQGAPSGTQAIEIGPGEVFTGSMWVPWGDSGDEDRHMQIWIGGQPYFRIWQKGRWVKFRTSAELDRLRPTFQTRDTADTAPQVPGQASQGGRRHLYVAMTGDGRPYFKIEAVQAQ